MKVSNNESMMARNFVHIGNNKSEEALARERANSALARQANRQQSILASAMSALDALPADKRDNYAEISLVGKKAARRMSEERQAAAFEGSEENLKKIREEISTRAEDAIKNKDSAQGSDEVLAEVSATAESHPADEQNLSTDTQINEASSEGNTHEADVRSQNQVVNSPAVSVDAYI